MNDNGKRFWDNTLNIMDEEHIEEMADTLYKSSLSDTDSDELIIVEEQKKSNRFIFVVAACIVALIGVVTMVSVMLLNGGIEIQPSDSTDPNTSAWDESVPDTEVLPTAIRIWDSYHPDDVKGNPYISAIVPELDNALIEREDGVIYINGEYPTGEYGYYCESIYLSDLTGDGKPELCIVMPLGSDIVDWRILIIDCTTRKLIYEISDRAHHDYYLFIRNGKLCVKETEWCKHEALSTGMLSWDGTQIVIDWDCEVNAEFDRGAPDDRYVVEVVTQPTEELTENEQIMKLLYDYSHFIFITSFPVNEWNFDIVYEEDKIYVDKDTNEVISSPEDAQGFCSDLYKVKESWINELNGMITENMKNGLIDEYVYIYQNEWYIRPTSGLGGIGLGQSELILQSYEKPDENTLILNFTCVGYKEEWGTEEDIIDEGQVILKKTENGYLIDQCDFHTTEWLTRFSKIKYESEYYYFDKNRLTDNITQTDRNNDGAIATFELYYGQEHREITEDEIQLIYKRVFGDKLISDESIQNRVNHIGKTIGDLEIQLYNASGGIGNELIYGGIPSENREDWFLSKKPPQLFSSMEELYEIQKDVFSDITTYEDFLTKFDAFKFEDDGFYVKGRTPGLTSTLYNTPVLQYTSFGEIRCVYSSAVAVELDGEIKMAVIRQNCLGFTKDIYSVHIVPLTEIDGVLKFPRECDWETAFGKSK